jgi:hypothetical protein
MAKPKSSAKSSAKSPAKSKSPARGTKAAATAATANRPKPRAAAQPRATRTLAQPPAAAPDAPATEVRFVGDIKVLPAAPTPPPASEPAAATPPPAATPIPEPAAAAATPTPEPAATTPPPAATPTPEPAAAAASTATPGAAQHGARSRQVKAVIAKLGWTLLGAIGASVILLAVTAYYGWWSGFRAILLSVVPVVTLQLITKGFGGLLWQRMRGWRPNPLNAAGLGFLALMAAGGIIWWFAAPGTDGAKVSRGVTSTAPAKPGDAPARPLLAEFGDPASVVGGGLVHEVVVRLDGDLRGVMATINGMGSKVRDGVYMRAEPTACGSVDVIIRADMEQAGLVTPVMDQLQCEMGAYGRGVTMKILNDSDRMGRPSGSRDARLAWTSSN